MSFAHFYHENNSSLEQPFSANGRRMVGGRKRNKKIILPKAEVRNEQKLESKRFGLNRIQGRLCRENNETKEQTEGLRTTFV